MKLWYLVVESWQGDPKIAFVELSLQAQLEAGAVQNDFLVLGVVPDEGQKRLGLMSQQARILASYEINQGQLRESDHEWEMLIGGIKISHYVAPGRAFGKAA